jgi:hypothetical protein
MSERGAEYIATVRLSTKANETLALPGDACGRVPDASLDWLERAGKIKRKAAAEPEAKPRAAKPPRMREGD